MSRYLLVLLCLLAFQVEAAKATLTWTAPTRNTDGSALTNLAGYKIRYKKYAAVTWNVMTLPYPGRTTQTIYNLAPGTWQFCMKSYNNVGVTSVCTKTVQVKLL